MDSNNNNGDGPAVAEKSAETREAEQEPTPLDSGNDKNDDSGGKEDNKDKRNDPKEKEAATADSDLADASDKASPVGDDGRSEKENDEGVESTAEGAGASPAKNTRSALSTSASPPQKPKATKPAATRKSTKGLKSPKELGLAPLGPAPKPAIPIRSRRELRKLFFSLSDQQFEYEVLCERQRRIALAVEATVSAAKTAAGNSKRKRGAEDTTTATSPRKKRVSAKEGQYFIPGMPGVYPAHPIVAANVAKSKKGRSGKSISIDARVGYNVSNKPFTPKQLINEQKWEERYQQLQEFKTKYGHINVTNRCVVYLFRCLLK